MLIHGYIWGNMLSGLANYTKIPKPELTRVDSYVEFLLNQEVLNVLHNIDLHLDNILNYVDPAYHKDVREALIHLSKNIDKTVKLFNKLPEDVRLLLEADILNIRELTYGDILEYIVKYVPLYGEYEDIKTGTIYNVALYPAKSEMDSVEPRGSDIVINILNVLDLLIRRFVKFDVKERIVWINDVRYNVPLTGFIDILRRHNLADQERKNIFIELARVLEPSLCRFGTINISKKGIIVKLEDIAREMREKQGVNIDKLSIRIEPIRKSQMLIMVHPVIHLKIGGKIIKINSHEAFTEGLGKVCKFEKCNLIIPRYTFSTNQVSEIPELVEKEVAISIEIARITHKVLNTFASTSKKYGYKLIDYSYMHLTFEKSIKGDNVKRTITLLFPEQNIPTISYRVEINTAHLRDGGALLYRRLETELKDCDISRYEGTIIIEKEMYYVPNINLDDLFNTFEEIYYKAKDIEDKTYSNKPNIMEYPPEVLAVIHLINIFGVPISLGMTTGEVLYNVVGKINLDELRKIPSPIPIPYDQIIWDSVKYKTLYEALKSGYLRLGEGETVFINNRRLLDVVSRYVKSLAPSEIREIERHIAKHIFNSIKNISEKQKRSVTEVLVELNLADEKIILPYIEYFKPEDFIVKIDGIPFLYKLSKEAQIKYINSLLEEPLYYLIEIYSNDVFRNLFSDYIDVIERNILSRGEPNIATRIVSTKYRDKIGLPDNVRVIVNENFCIIPFDRYMVQVLEIGGNTNKFIIYDKEQKGFIIEGKTLTDAIKRYVSKQYKLKQLYEEIRELIDKQERYDLREYNPGSDYTYYFVFDTKTKSVLPIDEKTLKLIRDEIIRLKFKKPEYDSS